MATALSSAIGPRPSQTPRSRQDLEKGRVTAPTALRVQLLEAFQVWMGGGESGQPATSGAGTMGSHSVSNGPRRVWPSAVRTGIYEAQLRGDHQRDSSTIPISEKLSGRSVEVAHHLGEFVAGQSSSPHAASASQSAGDHGSGLAMDQACNGPVARLLRLVTTLRSHCSESERLLAGFRDGVPGCNFPASKAGREEHECKAFASTYHT